ncbi:MAG: sensor histidine kinase [Lachnospiraceae bacterium]|nr:sensor histidine kinase [Lachnospiraceae bacterium]
MKKIQSTPLWEKIRIGFFIALIIAITAQVNINFGNVAPGFVIAVDVVVLGVFSYSFRRLFSPMQIALLAAVFSPLFRFLQEYEKGESVQTKMMDVFPDTIFFVVYGMVFLACWRAFVKENETIGSFVLAAFFSDFIGNVTEVLFIYLIREHYMLRLNMLGFLGGIAMFRAIFVFAILVAVDYYADQELQREQLERFEFMVNQSIALSDEFRIVENNKEDVERVMKKAYALYSDLKEHGIAKEYVDRSLDIARGAHEIKGSYQGIVDRLEELRSDTQSGDELTMGDIVAFAKHNAEARAYTLKKTVLIKVHQTTDFKVKMAYMMISILRNLTINAVEAFQEPMGVIQICIDEEEYGDREYYKIVVKDNGPGIPKGDMENVFLSGYSTKVNDTTGYLQRGLGLPMVKEYVERDFRGYMTLESEEGEGTTFIIEVPTDVFEGEVK